MNNENQNTPNVNNPGDLGASALGAVPNPSPNPMPAEAPVGPVAEQPAPVNPVNPVPNDVASTPTPVTPSVESTPAPTAPGMPVNPTGVESTPMPSTPVENTASSTEPIVNPQPMANAVPPVTASPDLATNLGAIEQPIPGTNSYTATSNANSNAFVEQKQNETVGTEPPAQNDNSKKKPMNKALFIILIVALLAGIAYGVYYYLSLGKSKAKVSVTPRDLEVEINGVLSSDIADYATLSGTDAKNCQLNTDAVDLTTEGVYEYKISCGNDTFTGYVNVVNNSLPTVQTKNVYKGVSADSNVELKAEDFIVENTCSSTDCKYAFADSESVKGYLATAGNYDISITVTDGNDKVGTVTSKLIVLASPLKIMMVCTLTREDGSKVTDRLAIGEDNTFIDYANRVNEFTFKDQESYNAVAGEKKDELTYSDVSGRATYDDANMKLSIESDLTIDTLNKDFGGTFPRNYMEINQGYTTKGYTCTVER